MAIQAVAWGVFLLFCLTRFRRGRNPRAARAGVRPLLPALVIGAVIAGDAVLLATAAIPAWFNRSTLLLATPLEIRVVAEQFAWSPRLPC